jgi:hypothetical protein
LILATRIIEIYDHEINISIKRCGFETKLIVNSEEQAKHEPHPDSLKAIQKVYAKD